MLFIDGSHEYEGALYDLRNFELLANQTYGHIVLVDDFGCKDPYCRHVRTAFYKMVRGQGRELMEREGVSDSCHAVVLVVVVVTHHHRRRRRRRCTGA